MVEKNRWKKQVVADPEHAHRYAERFRTMAEEGADLTGEARLADAMAPRGARILDAGCGQGRVGGHLHALGHTVVGVDLDATLIEAAQQQNPGPQWIVGDLAELDLPARGVEEPFDIIVSAGNVMAFLDPSTRREVLSRLAQHLGPEGRLLTGFGSGRGYPFTTFLDDAQASGLLPDLLVSTWDLRSFGEDSDFLVAALSRI